MDIDVHSYQEELDQIVADARAVLTRMDEMKHRMDAVAARVDHAEHSIGNLKSEIDTEVNASAQQIAALHQLYTDKYNAFGGEVSEPAQRAINDLLQKIAAAEAAFTAKSGEAYQAVDKSHGVVQQLGELVKSTDHDVMDGVRTGVHALNDDIAQFKQQFDGTTHPSLATLDDHFAQTQQQAEQFAHETHDQIAQVKQQVDEHIQSELFQPMQSHLSETAQKLSAIASGDVDAKLHDVMDHAREQLEQQAKQVIGNLVDKVAKELDTVADHIHQAGQGNAIPREAMKPIIDGVESLIKPVQETIGNVKSVAAAVGFDV
jgi:DNA anti-recombination protein RmuC